jgi:hypothetical protein
MAAENSSGVIKEIYRVNSILSDVSTLQEKSEFTFDPSLEIWCKMRGSLNETV